MDEGWFQDPFHLHDLRWFSRGWPTELVRDGDVESADLPPSPTWDGPLIPAATPAPATFSSGGDLRRADDGLGDLEIPELDDRSFVRRWFDRLLWLPF